MRNFCRTKSFRPDRNRRSFIRSSGATTTGLQFSYWSVVGANCLLWACSFLPGVAWGDDQSHHHEGYADFYSTDTFGTPLAFDDGGTGDANTRKKFHSGNSFTLQVTNNSGSTKRYQAAWQDPVNCDPGPRTTTLRTGSTTLSTYISDAAVWNKSAQGFTTYLAFEGNGIPTGAYDVSSTYVLHIIDFDDPGKRIVDICTFTQRFTGNYVLASSTGPALSLTTATPSFVVVDDGTEYEPPASEETVNYSFDVDNKSDTIFIVSIVETVDAVETVRETFASQPGDYQYTGSFLAYPETSLHVTVADHLTGIGPTYNYTTESGATWAATWEITEDTVPTNETAVGFTTVGEHDGVVTVLDLATGETLSIFNLGDANGQFQPVYDSAGIDVQLSGTTATLTQDANGDYIINPTADGAPSSVTNQLGSYVDSEGNLQTVDETTVTSGGTDYQFGAGGENYEPDDTTLERIDIETKAAMGQFDPEADQALVDSAIAEGLSLQDKYDEAEAAFDGDSDGQFDLIPVPDNWYAGLGRASEWRVPMPYIASASTQMPDMVVDLTHPAFPIFRALILVGFGVMLLFAAYRFAKI